MAIAKQLSYIPWFDSDSFRIKVILGDEDIYYNLDTVDIAKCDTA